MTRQRKPGNPKQAVAYIRASTADQRLSPDAQRSALEAWAAREGVQIASWHIDQGVSGSAPLEARPALLQAVDALRASGAGLLLVLRRDRLAREVAVAALIDRAVGGYGGRVVCADGAGNGDQPADAFMRVILDGVAAYEKAMIRQRTKAALHAKRARGERAGAVPYGYTANAAGLLAKDRVEQETIAAIRQLRTEGKTIRAIAAELAARGTAGRTGKPLSHTQVHRIAVRMAPA